MIETARPEQALLWAYQWQNDHCQTLDAGAVNVDHNGPHFQWAHICFDAENATQQLNAFGLKQDVIDALVAPETRPRTITLKNGVLIVLRGINNNHDADPEDMISLRIWFTKDFVITAKMHGKKLLSIEDARHAFQSDLAGQTPAAFVVFLIEKLADRIGNTVDIIEDDLTRFETELADSSHSKIQTKLAITRRQTAAIRRHLTPQKDALDALNRISGVLTDNESFLLRQQSDRTTRYVEDLELARERAIYLQEELRSQIAEQQNKRMYVLSIVTAIFLPLSFLTGVFGMNVGGLPGTENSDFFHYLVAAMVLILIFIVGIMYWRKWL